VRVTLVNLFYPPDLAPSAHLAASLAEHRAALGDRVTIVSGRGTYLGGTTIEGDLERAAGPDVIRLWTPALGKANAAKRLGDYLAFFLQAVARLLVLPRQDVIVALTTPPFIVAAAVAHRILHPRTRVILWSHDVYPDAVEAYGTIRPGGPVSRALHAINRWLLRRVDHVVGVDPAVLDRVLAGADPDGTPDGSVIFTWEPVALFPADRRPDPWSGYDDPDLAGRFVVLHLGNLGFGHRTDTIADAAAALSDDGVTFLFVGGGARYGELADAVSRRGASNVRFRDYVPKELTPAVLAGAGATLISLDDRSIGIMSPCKMNGSLAMGVPVVYAGPEGTNVDHAIATFDCGSSLRQGDVDGVVEAIRRLRDDADLRADRSRNARRAFEASFSDEQALPRFDELFDRLASAGAPRSS
jgi:glycosyltransferase involved in cell wall biosynthesis